MKPCLLLFALLGCACYSFCQSTDSLEKLRDHYLRIGRHETTVGAIMLGGGLLSILTTAYLGFRELDGHTILRSSFEQHLEPGILYTGYILTITSIPVFIVADAHKSRARHLSVAMQRSSAFLQPGRIGSVFQPALTLSLDLSKRKRGE